MMQQTISTLFFALAFGETIFAYDGFTNPVFWSTFDAGDNGVGTDPDGYAGAVFDGRYIYFGPQFNGTAHYGEVLRYDTLVGGTIPAVSGWGVTVLSRLFLVAGTLAVRRSSVPA